MSEGKRPGGLTALAVINFVLGGINAIGFLGMFAVLAVINTAAAAVDNADADPNEAAKAWEDIGMGMFYFLLLLMGVTAFLLIASGVGYLKQKKTLGRGLGNAYALLSIIYSVAWGMVVSTDAGGGFTLGTLIGLFYPVLTLALLNTTFKHDFTR